MDINIFPVDLKLVCFIFMSLKRKYVTKWHYIQSDYDSIADPENTFIG